MRQIPRIQIAHLPTPIEPLSRLSAYLRGPHLYVKRDDQTGLALGGNKTRKLEFLIAEALTNGAKSIITTGALQSNHCRQTAAASARFGLDCTLILVGIPDRSPSGNLLLDHLFGAKILWASPGEQESLLQKTYHQAVEDGRSPYLVPYGGSSPTGAAAYAYAMQEMIAQEFHPDWIIFASSSGGTQAGLALGARIFGYKGNLLGISVDKKAEELCSQVVSLATETAKFLDLPFTFSSLDVLVDDAYLGDGYGVMGKMEKEAIQLFARHEGLILDPVYTGKAGAGLINLIQQGRFTKDEQVLFWHTGGTPAIFADRYQDIIG